MSSAAEDDSEQAGIVVYREPPWTQDQLHMISGYVTAGNSIPCACEAVGVKWTTASNWMKRGRAGLHPYVLFFDAMIQAKAMHEAGNLLLIMQEARGGGPKQRPPNWKAAQYLDQRRMRFNAQQRGELGEEAPSVEATVLVYPVAMPEGADPNSYTMPGQAVIARPEGDEHDRQSDPSSRP